jgi:integrase
MPIVNVLPSDAQQWANDRADATVGKATGRKLATSSVASLRGNMSTIFRAAMADRIITSNPFTGLSVRKRGRKVEVVPPTVAEVKALAATIKPDMECMVIVQAATGLRISELLALRVFIDIDMGRRVIHVTEQMADTGFERVPLKTEGSARDMRMPEHVVKALAAHMQLFPPVDGYVFTGANGKPWHYEQFNGQLARAAKAAGTARFTSHAFRHHYASVLIAANYSAPFIAKRLGHTDGGRLVMSTYGHLWPSSEDGYVAALEAAWSPTACAPLALQNEAVSL